MRLSLGIRGLLLAVNAFALLVPIAAIVLLRIFDDQLIRRTEAQLIGESVLIAEAWREAWLREQAIDPAHAPRWLPPEAADQRYFPIEPSLRLDQGVLPPTPDADPGGAFAVRDGPAWRAGRTMEPVLRRAVRMNLSSARVLDAQGCVVASSGEQLGACLGELAEVRDALAGRYAAVLRERISDEPTPGVESISRRGRVRVYTALPVLADGAVIGVVRMSRTAIDPAKALWFDRRRLLAVLFGCALLTAGLSLFLSRTLSRPLRAITRGARDLARGEGRLPVQLPGLAPEELREVSGALDQMIAQLSDRAEYISEFATTVSHELKTPITAIRGAAELLSQQWREMSAEERARFLANIEQDAERMERLVARLLHLARIQSAPEFAQEVALGPFLAGLAETYGANLHVTLANPGASLRIHPEHLLTALRNLLDNAFRHGAGKPVELDAFEHGGRAVFRVRDRGPGISEGNRERIFQRFFTTERDRGGTGLGLVIARAVATTRGGDLRFETSAEGTCFELVL
ncbi:MAG: HAMP domain-containing protein [Deltaproteobacteria bacterium]|nr:MAG: HAMP domain-containing protein [Deltaproteobacteria bacterium]